MKKFNKWLAVTITKLVSNIWCSYLFAVIAFISLPAAIQSGNIIIIVGWIAQTFLQLVLLSIIMVGQNIQSEASDKRIEKLLVHITKDNDRILDELLNKRRK